ncbi:MAG: DUF4386 domain-containing protein [Cytophagaceae bacterium]|nr:DUF4386 domain-containing protein [Cytophagaceae bacterium]MBL0303223.1 DUF4386 domain-containing protein [Cytophagaceae bacterium]MBL0326073.1 DUF4386 domain-containing protein [Cytophagaceae bacterium]
MDNSTKTLEKEARLAGFFYLLHILLIIYGVFFVSFKLGISGTKEMAENIIANEFLFRTGIVSRIISMIPTLLMALFLYRILKNVSIQQARFMFSLILISIPFQFVAEVFNLTSLMIAKEELLKSIDSTQRIDFSILFINIYNNMVSIGQMFWGLWLFPLGLLIYKSKFILQFFGTILFLGGVGYLIDYVSFLFFPDFRSVTVIALLMGLVSEISIMLWLLLKGIKNHI